MHVFHIPWSPYWPKSINIQQIALSVPQGPTHLPCPASYQNLYIFFDGRSFEDALHEEYYYFHSHSRGDIKVLKHYDSYVAHNSNYSRSLNTRFSLDFARLESWMTSISAASPYSVSSPCYIA